MITLNPQTLSLSGPITADLALARERWRRDGLLPRLWQRDATVWTGADEAKWLGWLTIVDREQADDLQAFASEVARDGFRDALVLGMGGSSLGPDVLAETFPHRSGWPRLRIVDSTDPDQIRETEIDIGRTLFIVASKSGSTLEPNLLKDYFFARARQALGADAARHFVAITDPGSALEQTARSEGFRRIFFGHADIGGRFSVLSRFGLVPAAVSGIDVKAFLDATRPMVAACAPDSADNPGLALGLALGAAARNGRDKLTIIASPGVASFGAWIEQLVAESTGKNGKAIIPVDLEPLADPDRYGADRLFVALRLATDADTAQQQAIAALETAGQPVIRITLPAPETLGQEFFRWEIATAVAGAELGINPFDQPDVEANKIKTRHLTDGYRRTGALPTSTPIYADSAIALYADPANAKALAKGGGTLTTWLAAHLQRIRPGDYVALLAYLSRNARNSALLTQARVAIRDRHRVATCLGFGPRFLHSTGQAYKGGPNSGVFLHITTESEPDLAIPGQNLTFGVVEAAQAQGDFDVLAERGRRLLRVHIKGDVATGLATLTAAIRAACG